MGILAVAATLAFEVVHDLRGRSEETKLRRDVAALNAAVRVYVANGGSFGGRTTPQAIVDRLKAVGDAEDHGRLVGLEGSMVDPRLRAVLAPGEKLPAGMPRAVWDAADQQFEVTTAGVDGVAAFVLDDALGVADYGTDGRRSPVLYSAVGDWVWDYRDSAATSRRPGGVLGGAGYGGPGGFGSGAPTALRLNPPGFSIEGGTYYEEAFDLPLHFENTNPSGTSEIWFSVDGGDLLRYEGFPVMVAAGAEVRAYTRSLDPNAWIDSDFEEHSYEADLFYLSGEARGWFFNPTGDDGLVSSLGSDERAGEIWWGDPYAPGGFEEGNYLRFDGTEFRDVRPGEEFEVGTLTFSNSTTYLGTNATHVSFDLDLSLEVPDVTAAFTYGFDLLTTPNRTDQTADENADYVWLGWMAEEFATEVRGYDYELHLRFGDLTENGFTTIDTFHVHESKSASGKVYGTLIRTITEAPPQPADVEIVPEYVPESAEALP